jgi:hypothetical protein
VWVVEANLDKILLASNALGPIIIRKNRRRSSQKKLPQEHCKFVFSTRQFSAGFGAMLTVKMKIL